MRAEPRPQLQLRIDESLETNFSATRRSSSSRAPRTRAHPARAEEMLEPVMTDDESDERRARIAGEER